MPSSAYSTPTYTQSLKKKEQREKQDSFSMGFEQERVGLSDKHSILPNPVKSDSQSLTFQNDLTWNDHKKTTAIPPNGPNIKVEPSLEKENPRMQESVSTGIRDDFDLFNEFSSLDYYEPPLFGSESFIDPPHMDYIDSKTTKVPSPPPPEALPEPIALAPPSKEIPMYPPAPAENTTKLASPTSLPTMAVNPPPGYLNNNSQKVVVPILPATQPSMLRMDSALGTNTPKTPNDNILVNPSMMLNVPQVSSIPIENEPNRVWELQQAMPGFQQIQFSVEMKHRRENRHQSVDDTFYSSLRYQLFIKLVSEQLPTLRQLRVMIHLIDATTHQIVEPIKGDNVVVKGSNFLLTNLCGSTLKGSTSIHIPSKYSYHFLKKDYRLVISFYPRNLDVPPCFVLQSPQFRLFARRPNKKQFSREKQKRIQQDGKRRRSDSDSEDDEDIIPPPAKKLKTNFTDPTICNFMMTMNQVSNLAPSLSPEQKQHLKVATEDFLKSLFASS